MVFLCDGCFFEKKLKFAATVSLTYYPSFYLKAGLYKITE